MIIPGPACVFSFNVGLSRPQRGLVADLADDHGKVNYSADWFLFTVFVAVFVSLNLVTPFRTPSPYMAERTLWNCFYLKFIGHRSHLFYFGTFSWIWPNLIKVVSGKKWFSRSLFFAGLGVWGDYRRRRIILQSPFDRDNYWVSNFTLINFSLH